MKSKSSVIDFWLIPFSQWLVLVSFAGLVLSAELDAQILQPVAGNDSTPSETKATEIKAIYELTRTASEIPDFKLVVQRCEKLLETDVGDKDRKYLNSLISWSENRCAGKHIQNALALLEMGLTDQADEQRQLGINKLDHVIENHPLNWRAWMGRAVLHAEQGQYESALEKFRQVTRLNHRNNDAWFNCAEIAFHLEQYEPAIEYYSRLISEDPTDVQARTGRGHCFLAMCQLDQAVDDYRTVVNLRPDDSVALCNAGDACLKMKNWTKAGKFYESAARLPSSGLGLRRLAHFHVTCTDEAIAEPKMAIELVMSAIEIDGPTPDALQTLSAAYRATGQFQLAEQTMTRAETGTDTTSRPRSDPAPGKVKSPVD